MLRVAIDVGGTFTDLCALNEESGEIILGKVLTTPYDYSEGVVNAFKSSGVRGEDVTRFVGTGSTLVINAIIEKKGVKTALITTKGFRDVLEIQRSNRPDMYNYSYKKPTPFVPRYLILEVLERVASDGSVMIQQVTSIFEAQRSRGWSVSSRNPLKAIRGFVPTVLPIITRSISRSEFIAAAMASRGYGYNPSKRTSLKELRLTRVDWICIAVLVTFLVLNQLSAFVFKLGDYRDTVAMIRVALGISI